MEVHLLTRIRKIGENVRRTNADSTDLKPPGRALLAPGNVLLILILALSSLSILVTSAAAPAYAQAIPPGDKLITPYNSYVQIVYAGASCESNNNFGYVNYPANDPAYRTQIGTTDLTAVGTTVGLGDFAAGQELILYIEKNIGPLWMTGPADRCCFDRDFPHAKIVQINESVYRVSFEDTSEIFSDKDYDDVVMDVYFIKPTASVSVAAGAGGLVNEPSTSIGTVTLSRTFSWPVTVTVAADGGTATYGTDYAIGLSGAADSSSLAFDFTPGEASRSFEVRVKDDHTYSNPYDYFNVHVASTSDNAIANTALVPVTISEETIVPTVRLGQASYTVDEPAAGTTISLPFTVMLSEPCSFDTTVSIGTVAGSASAVRDFSLATGSIVIPAGQTTGTGSVTVTGDGLFSSPDKTFGLVITRVDHSIGIGTPGQATVTIKEYSSSPPIPPTVQLNSDIYTAVEPASGTVAVPFTVTISVPCDFDVIVNIETIAGTAIAGEDYDLAAASVTIPAGATSADSSLAIKNDGLFSLSDQQFTLKIAGATSPVGIGTQSQAMVTIKEYLISAGTAPTVQFNATDYYIKEPAGYLTTAMPFNVTLSEPCDFPVTVYVGTTMGTAVPVDDYTTLIASPVTINPGETSATGYVTVKGDGLYSAEDQQFTLDIISVTSPLSIGMPDTATVTIKEYPYTPGPFPPTVQFDASGYAVTEPGAGLTCSVPFTVTVSEPCDFDTTVRIRTVADTAIAGTNYDATVANVVIPAGASSAAGSVAILNDYTYSPSDRTFKLEITGNNRLLGTGTPAQATVTITNCDPKPAVQLNASAYDAPEDGTGYVNVTLTGNSSIPVIVQYAIDGVPGTYTFDPATQGFALIPVPVLNEPGIQTGRTLSFVITGVSDNARLGTPTSAIITILEKEQTYVLHLKKGWNMVSVPVVIKPFMVSQLNSMNGDITRAMMYDSATQQYRPYKVGALPEYDFEFRTDVGYLIYCTQDTELTLTGELPEARSVELANSWNMVGWSTFGTSDAISVCNLLPGSQRIMMYDAVNQAYLPYKELAPVEYNFPMGPGSGYLIYSDTVTPLNWGVFV